MTLSTALKQLRTELGLRQNELAALLNLNITTVNRWETGKRIPNRSISMLIINTAKTKGASKLCIENLQETLFPEAELEEKVNDLRNTEIRQINQLVNESLNAIIVFGAEDKEIVYANNKASEMTGIPIEKIQKMKCYEFFLRRNTPCENCIGYCSSEDSFTDYEYKSPYTGRHMLIRGRESKWGEQSVMIKYVTDMTETYKMRVEAEKRQQMLNFASSFSGTVVFQYDIQAHCAHLVSNEFFLTFLSNTIENYPQAFLEKGIILSEYIPEYLRMIHEIENGAEQAECEVRAKRNGILHWIRYCMNLYDCDETGKPLTAICVARLIDKDKAMKNKMSFEHKKIMEESKKLLTYVVSNLTQNFIEKSHLYETNILTDTKADYDQSILGCKQFILNQDEWKYFKKVHSRSNLMQNFDNGIQNYNLEYQFTLMDGHVLWVKNILNLYREPVSGDVYLYEYCYDIQEEKIYDGFIRAACMYNYDAFAILNLENESFTTVHLSSKTHRLETETQVYSQAIVKFAKEHVIEEDIELFLNHITIPEIRKLLGRKEVAALPFRAKTRDGKIHKKMGRISWFDEKNQICLMSILDMEENVNLRYVSD